MACKGTVTVASHFFYSVLNASTGSFLEAIFEGIRPEIRVSTILITTRIIAPSAGSLATSGREVRWEITALMGIVSSIVEPIPNAPETNPTIRVSALNTLEISFFDAPIARRIPISLVLSRTEIYVIIPIIIDETTSEIATNAIRTYEMISIMVETDERRSPI